MQTASSETAIVSAPAIRREGLHGSVLDVPRPLTYYLQNSWSTGLKLLAWMSACWQLRACDVVGRWCRVEGSLKIVNKGYIALGDRTRWDARRHRSFVTTLPGGRLEVGDRTFVNAGLDLAATGFVRIGSDVMIGTNVMIIDNNFHGLVDRDRMPVPKPVIIGDGVWIGNRAMVLPGVTIGDGAVIGAGSVVRTDIPPRTLALGNPAQPVKSLS